MTTANLDRPAARIVIIGGGPGGYEAALVARRQGADVTIVERQGMGGAAVLTDVVPSKTLIATADWMTIAARAGDLGISFGAGAPQPRVDLEAVNTRVMALAAAQSADIRARLEREGVRQIVGTGRVTSPSTVVATAPDGTETTLEAEAILVAVGATPRELPAARPDGERILNWTQLYRLTALPERLIVVGSGVTGAEFAGAYNALGVDVVLVSSRDHVLPGEDPDAASLIEEVFRDRGMTVMSRSRAESARVVGEGPDAHVEVTLADGQVIEGSHVLVAVGSVPSTAGIGLEEVGVALTESGHIETDRVSRTSVAGIYAAGDCTGVFPLASVAAMQGRIAMAHALGDAVRPIRLRTVAANIFTAPEIATVGSSEKALQEAASKYRVTTLPLNRNPRAKMLGMRHGFVKLFSHPDAGVVLGGVVVAPRASELIFPITLAVEHRLTVDEVAEAFTIYPSLSGSIAEVARMGHNRRTD
ncbi:NAD(P)H-quinone dehydrogenase [Flavimobilis marinus]|uniref:Dihydrolipoamide dehydrogenase n=1 Tax=Flavimobilis marinus TaxID=285351 RepID=A0A1I2DR69_9MICO|nr:NAD(P)H-quinone dehydrogenase [Flavimobilis marinus]GHG44556.1 NAD(P)H-quinone dehydrogenase [Flavimobilis marinus]SFE82977.1 dihydrolipoamide dehydrogenase [Flavimobilis marinus]